MGVKGSVEYAWWDHGDHWFEVTAVICYLFPKVPYMLHFGNDTKYLTFSSQVFTGLSAIDGETDFPSLW